MLQTDTPTNYVLRRKGETLGRSVTYREDNVEDRMGRFIISVTVDRKLPDYAEYKISIKRTNPRRG